MKFFTLHLPDELYSVVTQLGFAFPSQVGFLLEG